MTTTSWILLPASLADVVGTSVLYLGLEHANLSSYEILKGSVIIFTALSSRIFLRTQMSWRKWCSILVTIAGLTLVGLTDYLNPHHEAKSAVVCQ